MDTVPQSVPTKPPADEVRALKIVLFYEDFSAAIRAYNSFDWLTKNFGSGRAVSTASWSFDMLGMSRLSPSVLHDSTAADVLVVSAHKDQDLPPHVAIWVDRCISQEPETEPVLVALFDDEPNAASPAAPLCASLMRIAKRRHARFLRGLDHDFPPESESGASENSGREVTFSSQRWSVQDWSSWLRQ